MEASSNGISSKLQQQQQKKQKKWFFLLISSLLFSTLLVLITISSSSTSTLFFSSPLRTSPRGRSSSRSIRTSHGRHHRLHSEVPIFVESKLRLVPATTGSVTIPRLAYLISGSAGDGVSIKRALKALYHPRNQYAVHLDLEATAGERMELVRWVRGEKVFEEVGNVKVLVRSNLVTYRGPTMVSNTLHAAAILLREAGEWDWFINLSASDYPLVTQDDLLHTLSTIPRSLNFIEHTSDIGWKEFARARPVIVDPGLYTLQKSEVFWVSEKRNMPTAFKLFTGSAWMMLSRPFIEYMLWGWDNLPRVLLMYYANFLSTPEGYFHTLICNAEEFRNTTVNHDLHFIHWDNPPKQHPHYLTLDHYQMMVESNAPFARKFAKNEPVLDKIDSDILGRTADGFAAGGWLVHTRTANVTLPYNVMKNTTEVKPGPGAERLRRLITGLLSAEDFHSKQCS